MRFNKFYIDEDNLIKRLIIGSFGFIFIGIIYLTIKETFLFIRFIFYVILFILSAFLIGWIIENLYFKFILIERRFKKWLQN